MYVESVREIKSTSDSLVGNPEGKRLLRTPTSTREDNIETTLK